MDGFRFNSTLFAIEPDEDVRLNPGIHGRQLARWLSARFAERGDAPHIIAEDWGYCVMLSRASFPLWIGCGDMEKAGNDAAKDAIVWHCFAVAEVSPWRKLFRKRQVRAALQALQADLRAVLDAEPAIALIEPRA